MEELINWRSRISSTVTISHLTRVVRCREAWTGISPGRNFKRWPWGISDAVACKHAQYATSGSWSRSGFKSTGSGMPGSPLLRVGFANHFPISRMFRAFCNRCFWGLNRKYSISAYWFGEAVQNLCRKNLRCLGSVQNPPHRFQTTRLVSAFDQRPPPRWRKFLVQLLAKRCSAALMVLPVFLPYPLCLFLRGYGARLTQGGSLRVQVPTRSQLLGNGTCPSVFRRWQVLHSDSCFVLTNV